MRIIALSLLFALTVFGADDWAKVRDLHSGTELRIYKKDGRQPVLAKMGDSTEDSLVVVLKNEEVSIPKDQIERIDYRPQKTGQRVTTETKNTVEDPNTKAPIGPAYEARVPTTSTSSNVSFGGKPDFETIYRRTPGPAVKK